MRIAKPDSNIVEGDLTPMIDMTFQLIAFFMVLVNFTEAEQDERIKLPTSVLAKPPEEALTEPIFLQLTRNGKVLFAGEPLEINRLRPVLITESNSLKRNNKSPADATVIIRADADAPIGKVQELIQICQESRFEKFKLRAEEEVPP